MDIDAADTSNELAAVEYVEDLYRFYKEDEVNTIVIILVELAIDVVTMSWTSMY